MAYAPVVAYDDEFLHLEKPAGVRGDTWKASLGDYAAALALYGRVTASLGYETRAGRMPTDDQLQAEDRARELLTIVRTALLDLFRSPPGRDCVKRTLTP